MGSTPALAFSITADEQPLVDALNRANDHAKRSADSIGSSFAEVGKPFELSLSKVVDVLGGFARDVRVAMDGGADGIENALVPALEKLQAKSGDVLDTIVGAFVAKMGPIGKLAASAWSFLGDDIKKMASEGFVATANMARDAWVGAAGDAASKAAEAGKALDQLASRYIDTGGKFQAAAEGVGNALDVFTGHALKASDFNTLTAEMDKQVAQFDAATAAIGKTSDALARMKVEQAAAAAAEKAGADISVRQRQTIDEKKEEVAAAAIRKSLREIEDDIDRQTLAQERAAAAYTFTAAQAALVVEQNKAIDKGIPVEKIAEMQERWATLARSIDARIFAGISAELAKQEQQLERQIELIGKTADEAARLRAIWAAQDKYGPNGIIPPDVRQLVGAEADNVKLLERRRIDADTTAEIEKQAKAHQRNAELIGKTAEESAKLRAIWAAEDKGITGDRLSALMPSINANASAAGEEYAAQKAQRQAEQTKNLVAYVQQQAALQEANTAEVGKTAGEIARARVEAQVNLRITKEQLKLREDETKEIKEQLLIVEATANQRAMNAFDKGLDDAGRSAVANEQLALEMVGQRASEVARARFEQAEFNKAVHQGIPITGELSDRIHGWGQRLRDAAEAANTAKERINQMAQFGQIASSMLEKGFMRWTQGAKVGWQDLVGAMLIDMEKLAFKMAVLQPIFGGGASGSGLIGQIAASLFGGGASGTTAGWTPTVSIDGARAGGGDIDGGKMYLVGENGPELIRPRADATVVPNGMFGSGTSVPSVGPSVVLNITAPAGTTARETSRSQDSDGGMTIDVLFEQIEARIGGGIADGSSPVGAAIQSTFGVSRAAGAR